MVVIGAGFVVVVWWRPATPVQTAANTNTGLTPRERYATLYQAAWRQDDGIGAATVTATILTPAAVTALGQDDGRSSSEGQLYDMVKSTDARIIPILITVDSIDRAIPDVELSTRLILTAAGGPKFVTGEWRPLIAPTRVVNTNQSTSSQIGVVLFRADQEFDWTTLGSLQLIAKNIGGTADRVLTWAQPGLLSEL